MADDIYVTSLRRAAELHGGAQELASALRVPESTLRRWMAGRAMMPMQAFVRLLQSIVEHEARSPALPSIDQNDLSFRVEDLFARCRECGGTAFRAQAPAGLADPVACVACGAKIVQRDLLLILAERAATRRYERAAARRSARVGYPG